MLSYIGVGVDPSTNSFGTMINAARLEMAREPMVWWSLAAAFTFMFVLVLAANLFADAVRDAFDPRIAVRCTVRCRMSVPLLHAEGLRTWLAGSAGLVRALDGVDLDIPRGETFALVGESGCGKSMTALTLLRLLPEVGRIVAGSVRLDGLDLLALPEARMRDVRGRRIAMISGAVHELESGAHSRAADRGGSRAPHGDSGPRPLASVRSNWSTPSASPTARGESMSIPFSFRAE